MYYDLLMWCFRRLPENVINKNQIQIKQYFEEVCRLDEFKKTKTGGLQRKESILTRRRLLKEKLELLNEQNSAL